MAISMSSLFTRLGKIVNAIFCTNGFLGKFEPGPSSVWSGGSGPNIHCLQTMLTNIQGQLQTPFPELLAGGVYGVQGALYALQTQTPSQLQGTLTYFQSLAQGLIIDTVNQDIFIPNITLQTAIKELVRQMIVQSATIKANVVTSTVTANSGNLGNPTFVVSVIDAHGKTLEYAYSDLLVATCTQDRFDGATAGNERISIAGPQGQVSPSLNPLWPSGNGFGSGLNTSITVVDPTQNNGAGGNLLNNSAWKGTWTANLPSGWTADVGSAGTQYQQSTSTYYAGTAQAFQFIGDSVTLTSVFQTFANGSVTTGNTTTLTPATVYLLNAYIKLSAAAGGILAFSLTDNSGVVLNDDAGNPCTVSQDVSTIADTNWHAVSGAIRTPTNMPTKCQLRMKLTTALTTGKNLFVDYLALTLPTQQNYGGMYTGGPYLAAFRGSTDCIDFVTNPAVGDRWQVQITNDYSSPWSMFFWQVANQPSIGFPIPSTTPGAATLSQTLIS